MSTVQDEVNKAFALVHDALHGIPSGATSNEIILAAALAAELAQRYPGEAHAAADRRRTNTLALFAALREVGQ